MKNIIVNDFSPTSQSNFHSFLPVTNNGSIPAKSPQNSATISFDLTKSLAQTNDWDSAYLIALELDWRQDPNKQYSTSIRISSKMLLAASILLAFQTPYPDLLCVRTLILLADLQQRLRYAQKQQKLELFGVEVVNGFQHFIDCPSHYELTDSIVFKTVRSIDLYLRSQSNLTLAGVDFLERSIFLKELFPFIYLDVT